MVAKHHTEISEGDIVYVRSITTQRQGIAEIVRVNADSVDVIMHGGMFLWDDLGSPYIFACEGLAFRMPLHRVERIRW